ncbi:MAG: hypothetical protein FJX62_18855 [Alphaproteobacteria bacterium]|nr:hypothetical protein [Alphaproteobacteria bacterium]
MIGAPIGGAPIGGAPLVYIIPAAHTKEGKERLRDYYEALGRFVDKFSRVEAAITRTLWHYAKTSPEIAKIVFSGAKLDSSTQYIKQIAKATNVRQELRDDLDDVFQQLGIINGVRNGVVHYGAEFVAEGNAIVSDALKAKGEPYSFPISPDALNDMTADLDKIIAHLKTQHLNDHRSYTILGNPMHSSWRYKHPVVPKTRQGKAEDRRTQTRDPK